jgi:hypothetical protein
MNYMLSREREQHRKRMGRIAVAVALIACSSCLMAVSGCNGLPSHTPGPTDVPQKYLAAVAGGSSSSSPLSYTFDENANPNTFVQSTISLDEGTTVNDTGTLTVLDRGLRSLDTTFISGTGTLATPLGGSYAVELAGQAGGLVQLVGQAATPLAAVQDCPSLDTAQTFQFITLPGVLGTGSGAWNPATDTAYGSVSIVGSGSTVNFSSIQQFTLPVNGGTPGTPANPSPSAVTGACSPTPYGNTISVPGSVTITNPGDGEGVSPSAIMGIGSTGLLVEWNGALAGSYENVLGAGTGAIGVPQPSSALESSAVVGAQYLGFIYGGGSGSGLPGWTSTIASYGFPTLPADCTWATQTSTSNLIYGGDFSLHTSTGLPNPSSSEVQANGGFPLSGNCNLAIDLGTQSTSSNGLYPGATVWFRSDFSANNTKKTYSLSAVGIVGQLQGKFVILLIGTDSAQARSLYLMQSN